MITSTAFKYSVTAAWSRRRIFTKFTDDFGKPPIQTFQNTSQSSKLNMPDSITQGVLMRP